MERKYYLRGLGIGIVVTAIIMGIALSGDKAMTDEEIISRAKKLGMVENTVLAGSGDDSAQDADTEGSDIVGEEQPKDQKSASGQGADADGVDSDDGSDAAADSSGEARTDGQEADSAAGNEEEQQEPEETEKQTAPAHEEEPAGIGDTEEPADESQTDGSRSDRVEDVREVITSATVKTITISHGDGSYTVARKLADVGVVTSADSFDTFLCQNGYDKRLRTGTFSIPADASDEQIARIVTGAE
ncbi:MAG: endolytic transglycosylase MltG [Lachnospiraceae bacterium]|nr:endolytic transglycosylase MltG [Lachnospiraceae bacterium]